MNIEPSQIAFSCAQRQALLASLPPCSIWLVFAGQEQIRNRDVDFPFRPQSDFWYLTGFNEPDATLALVSADLIARLPAEWQTQYLINDTAHNETAQSQAWLWLRPKDSLQERWQGRRLGVDAAVAELKVQQAWSHEQRDEMLAQLVGFADQIHISFSMMDYWSPYLPDWMAKAQRKVRQGGQVPSQIVNADDRLHGLRLIKSPYEIVQLRQAAQLSVQAHLAAMQATRPGVQEYQVQAALEAKAHQLGARRMAFNSIVAGGERACILHYTENQACLSEGELVLIDAGAEWQGYAGDISHTYPVSGRFIEPQRQLYELVLAAQQAVIAMIKPGIAYDTLHETAARVITEGLLKLGILTGELEELLKSQAYKAYFMHGTGHWLGLDVHDVGPYKLQGQSIQLQPGMLVTVEPGLYIDQDAAEVAACWRGIGIRIEDDVLVTEQGCEVLNLGLPRSCEEIEQWMQQNRQ
ncbi:aminopeptidase P N-terminal domain-containing protein [Thiomicrospira sp. ALE5]|uniref:aminopeptidase P N-terminal domain-containing protein n=1 Tax=Thiomicrospira sp. ALE5 TaxID=748650 RepID=UPI0008EF4972|nr:aminopeptidase P N-terminal domain-containing protein [Thiomicrospira sp. ALE5]SFR52232.1 Xaa-Pro aminopeptidase [Thiomicrospira sp. ALE5]